MIDVTANVDLPILERYGAEQIAKYGRPPCVLCGERANGFMRCTLSKNPILGESMGCRQVPLCFKHFIQAARQIKAGEIADLGEVEVD